MITEKDIQIAENLKKHLRGLSGFENHENWDWISLIDKMIHNLKIAPESFKPVSKDKEQKFFTVECHKCGWWGSSELLEGGGQIADTGDFDDTYCPVCYNIDLEDKA